jgi:hypothetical protein
VFLFYTSLTVRVSSFIIIIFVAVFKLFERMRVGGGSSQLVDYLFAPPFGCNLTSFLSMLLLFFVHFVCACNTTTTTLLLQLQLCLRPCAHPFSFPGRQGIHLRPTARKTLSTRAIVGHSSGHEFRSYRRNDFPKI